MWLADEWKDYEVIDCSKGEKTGALGRLPARAARIRRSSGIRQESNNGWKHPNGHYHRSKQAAVSGNF